MREAAGRLLIIHHAVFNNLDENLDAIRRAEAAGADTETNGSAG